mmetsp:Transcript_35779/g.39845  ORF Transcript_35779/g.39845 Transcript_35779/m.39845 type:complete len:134 (-) Transcript_35779:501-902(-)|eukprot:CAMPEP_0170819508 /NCGR_PEP_ID=MMETSP0733-20121128/41624_1 /TAXON_ID=186038 /ORGANISM="Fragilariopsis kerguelensis, Strain L26-C5" /LENGTH=133 /DNA_ID=CAMNT_0011180327 /DNA_START=401 /DNA_END=802 /DNA_ORIENTATION=+
MINEYTLRRSVIDLLAVSKNENENETEHLMFQVSPKLKVIRPSLTDTKTSCPCPASHTINQKRLKKDGDSKQKSSLHDNIKDNYEKQGEGVPTAFVVDLLGEGEEEEEEDQLALTKQQVAYLVQGEDEKRTKI